MKTYIVVLLALMMFTYHVEGASQANFVKSKIYGNKLVSLTDARSIIVEFGLGLVQGLQEDPEQEMSICQRDVLKLGTIYDDAWRLIDHLKNKGFDFLQIMSFVNSAYRIVMDIEEDCHVLGLFETVTSLLYPWTLLVKLIQVVLRSYIILPALVRFGLAIVWQRDARAAGFEFGFLLKNILDYSIKF
ncbi:unnamed protein product [Moneuplotes crassus]|uniref:Uncharacterized protein n=2 Tax=Euplotes crassus TaxID=5936 RepID=A0AAD1XWK0_EUPCR|nr:unnamed protein product [Moneuplotes crassus]